jgi:hypothetical protein
VCPASGGKASSLVERTRPYAASRSAPFYWWLTRAGARLVEGTSPAPGKGTPNPLFLRHTAAIAGLHVALVDLGPNLAGRDGAGLALQHEVRQRLPTGQRSHQEAPQQRRARHALVRNGHLAEARYKEPFDVLFSEPKFEYDLLVGAGRLERPTSAV